MACGCARHLCRSRPPAAVLSGSVATTLQLPAAVLTCLERCSGLSACIEELPCHGGAERHLKNAALTPCRLLSCELQQIQYSVGQEGSPESPGRWYSLGRAPPPGDSTLLGRRRRRRSWQAGAAHQRRAVALGSTTLQALLQAKTSVRDLGHCNKLLPEVSYFGEGAARVGSTPFLDPYDNCPGKVFDVELDTPLLPSRGRWHSI